jgi:hypothetical protein
VRRSSKARGSITSPRSATDACCCGCTRSVTRDKSPHLCSSLAHGLDCERLLAKEELDEAVLDRIPVGTRYGFVNLQWYTAPQLAG